MSIIMTSFWGIVPVLFLWTFIFFKQVECQLGVTYTPFVRPGDTSPTTQSYSIEDVKIMLNIISEDNFPFVSTYTVGAPNEHYQANETRYRCSSVVHTALAAAEINKEQKSLALTVYQGLYRHSPPAQLISEIEVGFEIAHAANQIYPGTVPAIIFPSSAGFNGLFDMEENLKAVSDRARALQLKFGVRVSNCETTIGKPDNYHKNKELLTLFDFLICEFMPKESSYSEGPEAFFEELKQEVKKVDHAIKEMSNGIHVIVETGWANAEMKMFWEKMGQWANKEKRLVSMSEAFDNPWKMEVKDVPFAAHYGIWKHLETEDNSKKAYERKVPQINTHNPLKPKPTAPSGRGGTRKPQKNSGSGNWMTSRLSFCVILFTTFILGGFLSYS